MGEVRTRLLADALRNEIAHVQNLQNEWALAYIEDDEVDGSASRRRFLEADAELDDAQNEAEEADDWADIAFDNAYGMFYRSHRVEPSVAVNNRVAAMIEAIRARRMRNPLAAGDAGGSNRRMLEFILRRTRAALERAATDNNGRREGLPAPAGGRRGKSIRRKSRLRKTNRRSIRYRR